MKLELLYQASRQIRTGYCQLCRAFSSQFVSLFGLIRQGWRDDADRRPLFAPVLLGSGIAAYFRSPVEPSPWLILLPVPIVAGLATSRAMNAQLGTGALSVLSLIATGLALSTLRAAIIDSPSIVEESGTITITGRVLETEPNARAGTRITLKVSGMDGWQGQLPAQLRLSVAGTMPDIHPGDWIRSRASLKPLPGPVAPSGFDFGRKLWFDGIRGLAFTLGTVERIAPPRHPTWLENFAAGTQRLRHSISDRIRQPMSDRTGPLAVAFLTGERGGITKADNQSMRDSSLAHLLSISGIHMMLAGFGFFSGLRLLLTLSPACAHSPQTRKWAAAAALAVSLAYLLLSGASVPTQRAFLTIAISFLAIMTDRAALSLRTVALAAFAILTVTPEAWMDPSFQMSFAAVAALVSFHEWWSGASMQRHAGSGVTARLWQMLIATAVTSLVAGLATAPFAAFHFNRLSLYGVAANLLVTPLVSFVIMPAGVLALLLMPFGLEWLPLMAMQLGLELMLAISAWVAAWPGATVPMRSFPVECLLLVTVGGLWITIWQARWRWVGLLPVLLGTGLAMMTRSPDIIISGSGYNVAFVSVSGDMKFASARRDRFDAGLWLRAMGDARDLSVVLQDKRNGFECSGSVCLALTPSGQWIAFSNGEDWPGSACSYADILITPNANRSAACKGAKLVIAREDIAREGAIAIWVDGKKMQWTSVNRERGQRPWTQAADTLE